MLIEFIGAAGTGKTFLSDQLVEELRNRQIAAQHFNDIQISRTAPRNWVLVFRAIYLAIKLKPNSVPSLMDAIKVIARYSIRRDICDQVADICVASEGLPHRIITLYRNSRSRGIRDISDVLFNKIRPADVVVVIEASSDTVFSRRTKRNRANDEFSIASIKIDIEQVMKAKEAIEKIQLEQSLPLKVMYLRADEEGGQSLIKQIVFTVESLLGGNANCIERT